MTICFVLLKRKTTPQPGHLYSSSCWQIQPLEDVGPQNICQVSAKQFYSSTLQNQNYNFHHKKTSTKSSGPMFVCYSYWETILPEITLNCYNKCKIVEIYHGDGIYEMFMLENGRPQCLVQFPSNLVQTILFQSPKWILKKDSMFKMKKKFWIQALCVVKVI